MQDFFSGAIALAPFFVCGLLSGSLFKTRPLLIITIMEGTLCLYLMSEAPRGGLHTLAIPASTIALFFAVIVAGQWIGSSLMDNLRKHDP